MEHERGSDALPKTSGIHDRATLGDHGQRALLKFAVIGALFAGVLGVLVPKRKKKRSEEPPIRVRDGSTLFELSDQDTIVWERVGQSRKVWRLSGGPKNKSRYTVKIRFKRNNEEQQTTNVEHPVRIHYGQNLWVELAISGGRTILISRDDLEASPDNRVLTLRHEVVSIEVGSETPFFAKDGELIYADIFDQ